MATNQPKNNVLHMQLGLLKQKLMVMDRNNPNPEEVAEAIALSERITSSLKELQSTLTKFH